MGSHVERDISLTHHRAGELGMTNAATWNAMVENIQ